MTSANDGRASSAKTLTERLIEDELHYCCPHAFFIAFRQTGLVALRLGLAKSTVRLWKARCDSGEYPCQGRKGCMKAALSEAKELGLLKPADLADHKPGR